MTDVVVKMADVKAMYLADVIAIVMWDGVITHILILLLSGRCYCHRFESVADVKTTLGPVYLMADVITICGWCYYHYLQLECIIMVADVITTYY